MLSEQRIVSTAAYVALHLALRRPIGADGANALALATTAVANIQANRAFTFDIHGRRNLARQHLAGALVYLLALGLTAGALDVLHRADPYPARGLEVAVLVLASAVGTVMRYAALRSWVFVPSLSTTAPTSAPCCCSSTATTQIGQRRLRTRDW